MKLEKAKEIKEKQDYEDGEATFKPKINKYSVGTRETSGDKCLDLYSRVKLGQNKNAKGRSKFDAEYEKEKDECSHTPKINNPGSHLRRSAQNVGAIKGVEE